MKICSLLLALFLLMGYNTYQPSTVSSDQKERDAWLQEQVQLAEEFRSEHQELLDDITAEVLSLAGQYPGLYTFHIIPSCANGKLLLRSYGIDRNDSQSQSDIFEISENLNSLLEELYAIHPANLDYYTASFSGSAEISLGFAYTSFPGAFFCSVTFICRPDGDSWVWEIESEEFCMDGL